KSPTASPVPPGAAPASYVTTGRNVPSPLPSKTPTAPSPSPQPLDEEAAQFTTTTSNFPSPFTSTTAIGSGPKSPAGGPMPPESKVSASPKVPSPLPSNTATSPSPEQE